MLQTYGVEVRNVVVVEGDQAHVWNQNPLFIIPNQEYHDILSPLRANNYQIGMIAAQAIRTLDLKKKTLKIEPLLTSTDKAYGKRDIASSKSSARGSGDLPGPFNLAVAITDPAADPSKQDTKLVVIGDAQFLASAVVSSVPGNGEFFMNSVGWLKGTTDSITIRAKSLQTLRLTLSNLAALLLSGVVVILMPLLVLGAGVVIWVRRRHL